jgi:dynein heavy chain
LHTNAQLFRNGEDTKLLLRNIIKTELSLTSNGSGPGGAQDGEQQEEDPIVALTKNILNDLPPNFDVAKASLKYPIKWEESMNTVLVQELGRYNRLLDEIRSGLADVADAIRGVAIMSQSLEEVARSIELGNVPKQFLAKSFPSLKPLASYFSDLNKRLSFLRDWAVGKPPPVYWISGFFFTQAFITGSMQNFARRSSTPIDQVGFNMQFMKKTDYASAPKSGVYIRGLFFEGGKWDVDQQLLVDCTGAAIICEAPIILLRPAPREDVREYPYACPVYRTSERRGQLSTTGLSTNFVMIIRVPTKLTQGFWKMRGAALLCSLSE